VANSIRRPPGSAMSPPRIRRRMGGRISSGSSPRIVQSNFSNANSVGSIRMIAKVAI